MINAIKKWMIYSKFVDTSLNVYNFWKQCDIIPEIQYIIVFKIYGKEKISYFLVWIMHNSMYIAKTLFMKWVLEYIIKKTFLVETNSLGE